MRSLDARLGRFDVPRVTLHVQGRRFHNLDSPLNIISCSSLCSVLDCIAESCRDYDNLRGCWWTQVPEGHTLCLYCQGMLMTSIRSLPDLVMRVVDCDLVERGKLHTLEVYKRISASKFPGKHWEDMKLLTNSKVSNLTLLNHLDAPTGPSFKSALLSLRPISSQ